MHSLTCSRGIIPLGVCRGYSLWCDQYWSPRDVDWMSYLFCLELFCGWCEVLLKITCSWDLYIFGLTTDIFFFIYSLLRHLSYFILDWISPINFLLFRNLMVGLDVFLLISILLFMVVFPNVEVLWALILCQILSLL